MRHRISVLNRAPLKSEGDYVLYWMTAQRRATHNFALDHALHYAQKFGRPLVILEALRCDYPWASARFHQFIVEGMQDNCQSFESAGVRYLAYVEAEVGEGRGLLEALAQKACLVIGDEFPCFFLPKMHAAAAEKLQRLGCRLELVDGNGLLPIHASDRAFTSARSFRYYFQKIPEVMVEHRPQAAPLENYTQGMAPYPLGSERRWTFHSAKSLSDASWISSLPIDMSVGPISTTRGGSVAAQKRKSHFLNELLGRYAQDRNHPDFSVQSGLSPYLHFGHISAHDIFWSIADRESWSPGEFPKSNGKREGFWGMSAEAEAYIDQLITWRELSYNGATHLQNFKRYESLPQWCQDTLAEFQPPNKEFLYPLETFESAQTHDPIWNAAQRQLKHTGIIHNYLRMLWGKKVLEWSKSPQVALEILIHLNNKYALDGRNPNSYAGIFWIFGRYDRPWGPKRPNFGTVRYMSSDSTRKKLKLKSYLALHGSEERGIQGELPL